VDILLTSKRPTLSVNRGPCRSGNFRVRSVFRSIRPAMTKIRSTGWGESFKIRLSYVLSQSASANFAKCPEASPLARPESSGPPGENRLLRNAKYKTWSL
jgi:hypothetical protein